MSKAPHEADNSAPAPDGSTSAIAEDVAQSDSTSAITKDVAQSEGSPADGGPSSAQIVYRYLIAAGWALVLVPALFYLRFGTIDAFGWSFTAFLVILCLLVSLGFYFSDRSAYHTQVPVRNDWLDKVGGFWLVACAFGPFFGWVLTALPLNQSSWRWVYGARVGLSIGLPVVTALPLIRYGRGKAALIALPLLGCVTMLASLSGLASLRDFVDGPSVRRIRVVSTIQGTYTPLDGEPLEAGIDIHQWGQPGDTLALTLLRHTRRVINAEHVQESRKVSK